jgi:ubiquinone/menaquinone biosynthesis C-methylase UbiE
VTKRDHYSYTVYADPETARSFDDRRFGGPIGDLIASTQAAVLAGMAGDVHGRPVLDVGTGTGRAALLLARRGAQTTALDASREMLAVARRRAAAEALTVTFVAGDVHALEFPDRAFDVVVCFRVLMHSPRWRDALAELCRVAGRLVIVDYPSSRSVAALQSAARRIGQRFGVRGEPYRVFSDREVADAFEALGFRVRTVHRQFVLPIAFHKAIGRSGLTRWIESLLDRIGLLGICGSPVTVAAERCVTS